MDHTKDAVNTNDNVTKPNGAQSNPFRLWFEVSIRPRQTLRKEKNNASLKKALFHSAFSGLICGIMMAGLVLFYIRSLNFEIDTTSLLLNLFLGAALMAPISIVLNLLLFSGIIFLIAKAVKGKGSFTTQTYLLSITAAPIMIVGSAISLFFNVIEWPFSMNNPPQPINVLIYGIIMLPLLIYALFLLLSALKEAHTKQ